MRAIFINNSYHPPLVFLLAIAKLKGNYFRSENLGYSLDRLL